jgi:hypothetical protein
MCGLIEHFLQNVLSTILAEDDAARRCELDQNARIVSVPFPL